MKLLKLKRLIPGLVPGRYLYGQDVFNFTRNIVEETVDRQVSCLKRRSRTGSGNNEIIRTRPGWRCSNKTKLLQRCRGGSCLTGQVKKGEVIPM